MREFEQKRNVRKVLSSPLVLVPLAIIFLLLIRSTWNIYLKDRASVLELKSSQERLLKLQDRQTALSAATQKLSTESGIEGEIRDLFQMAKDGEKEIVIVDSTTEQNQTTPITKSFLQKIIDFFTIR